jgi:hypothetical protein
MTRLALFGQPVSLRIWVVLRGAILRTPNLHEAYQSITRQARMLLLAECSGEQDD